MWMRLKYSLEVPGRCIPWGRKGETCRSNVNTQMDE